MQGFAFKPRRRIDGEIRESRFYSGKIRMEWWLRARVFALHTSDLREARRKIQTLIDEFEMERRGLLPPRSVREGMQEPIWQHLERFMADGRVRGLSENTLAKYRSTIAGAVNGCGWRTLRCVTPRSFCDWRIKSNLAPKSANDALMNLHTFMNWLRGQKVLTEDPLEHVGRVDTRLVRQYRRALSVDECSRLLANSPRERAILYLLILNTGLRRNEVAQVTWNDFDLAAALPKVRVPASISKNKKEARLPLRPEVVSALLPKRPRLLVGNERVFQFVPRITTLKRDLAHAGIQFIDASGRRIDLHSLRMTFGTNLLAAGVSPRVVMELMRHSDIKLTMKVYTDAAQLPTESALSMLPQLSLPEDRKIMPSVLPQNGAVHRKENCRRHDSEHEHSSEERAQNLSQFPKLLRFA